MTVEPLYYGSDKDIYWDTMTDRDGAAVTGATVTWALLTTARAALSPAATGSLTHVSSGTYRGTIESSDFSGVSLGTLLLLEVTASASGQDGKRTSFYKVQYRPLDV